MPAPTSALCLGCDLEHSQRRDALHRGNRIWRGPVVSALVSWPCVRAAEAGAGDSAGSAPCVDILVATPGRLMAHLKGTPGATLDHLRYLVSAYK